MGLRPHFSFEVYMSIIWIRPSGSEIEMPDEFNAKALRDLGWKKKPGPKKQEPETIQESLQRSIEDL